MLNVPRSLTYYRKLLQLIQLTAPRKSEATTERMLKSLERIIPTRAYDDFVREVSMLQKVDITCSISDCHQDTVWIDKFIRGRKDSLLGKYLQSARHTFFGYILQKTGLRFVVTLISRLTPFIRTGLAVNSSASLRTSLEVMNSL